MDDQTIAQGKKIFADREKKAKTAQFRAWCDEMVATPSDWTPKLKNGYVAEMELQPHWWLREGVTLINCRHIDSHVELMDGQKGPVMDSHLPYAVFLAATESFLKGMYLCRFAECRQIAFNGYIRPKRREHHLKIMRKFGHHLRNLIKALKRIKAYRTDAVCVRFLAILDGAIRRFYFPLRAAEENYGWATARYPKRFYNDAKKEGKADGLRTFPQQEHIAKLFEAMEHYLDKKWNLRRGLIERRKTRRSRLTQATASGVATPVASAPQPSDVPLHPADA